jgi:hypothetical protein
MAIGVISVFLIYLRHRPTHIKTTARPEPAE